MRFSFFAISLTPFRAKIKSRRDKLLVGSGSQALALYRFPASALLNWVSGCSDGRGGVPLPPCPAQIILEVVSRAAAAARHSTGMLLLLFRLFLPCGCSLAAAQLTCPAVVSRRSLAADNAQTGQRSERHAAHAVSRWLAESIPCASRRSAR